MKVFVVLNEYNLGEGYGSDVLGVYALKAKALEKVKEDREFVLKETTLSLDEEEFNVIDLPEEFTVRDSYSDKFSSTYLKEMDLITL